MMSLHREVRRHFFCSQSEKMRASFDARSAFEGVGTPGPEPGTSAMWLQRSKPTGLRPSVFSIAGAKVCKICETAKLFRHFLK